MHSKIGKHLKGHWTSINQSLEDFKWNQYHNFQLILPMHFHFMRYFVKCWGMMLYLSSVPLSYTLWQLSQKNPWNVLFSYATVRGAEYKVEIKGVTPVKIKNLKKYSSSMIEKKNVLKGHWTTKTSSQIFPKRLGFLYRQKCWYG